MPRFILLMSFTDGGVGGLDDLVEHTAAARTALEEAGGTWVDEHYTLGAYDVVATVEAASDEQAASFALALSAAGALRTTTLRAFTRGEFAGVVADAKLHGGKLHGGKLHGP